MTTETLRYLVEADYAQLEGLKGAVNSTNTSMARSQANAAKQQAAFHSTARSAGYLALGIGAIAVSSFKAAADFQKSLNVMQAVTGATGKTMNQAREEAIKLGNDLRLPGVSAKDAADAMVELGKGGFTARQSINAARGVLTLAQASQMDFASSATIVARVLKSYELPAKKAVVAVDAIAGASIKSTASMEEIAKGMEFSSTSAHTLGINVTDTATALAILNDRGVSGAKAGTALNMVLTRMAAPTKQGATEMKKLGLEFFNSKGQFVGMHEATARMTGALSKLNPQQRQQALQLMFAGTAMKGANLVFGQGTKQWDAYRKAVGKSGQAQKLAAAQTKGLSGAWEQAKNAVQTAAIQLGTVIGPAIAAVLGPAAKLLAVLGKYSSVVGPLLGVVGTLAAGIWLVSKAMKAWQTAVEVAKFLRILVVAEETATGATYALNTALLTNPFVLIIAAIVLLGVAFYELYKHSETFRRIIGEIGGAVATAAKAVADFAKKIYDAVIPVLKSIIDWVKGNWPLLVGALGGPLGVAIAYVITHWSQIKEIISSVLNAALGIVKSVWNAIRNAVTTAVNAVVSFARAAASRLIQGFLAPIRAGAALVRGACNLIKSAVKAVFGDAGGWLKAAGAAIIDGLIGGVTAAAGRLYGVLNSVKDKAKGIWEGIKGFATGSPSKWAIQLGYSIVDGLTIGITGKAPQAALAMANAVKRVVNAAAAVAKSQGAQLGTAFSYAFQQMQAGMDTEAGKALKALQSAHDAADRQQAIADAQAQVAAATNADELAAAQKALADATYQQQVADLQRTADEQQAALDFQKQQQQAAFDKQLTALQTYLASGHATAKGATKRIREIMDKFGIDLSSMGTLVGQQFSSSVEAMIPKVVSAAVKLAKAVKKALEKELHSSPWVTFTMGKTLSEEMARGLESSAGKVGQALDGIVPQPALRLAPAGPAAPVAAGAAVQIGQMNVATEIDRQRLDATLSNAVAIRR